MIYVMSGGASLNYKIISGSKPSGGGGDTLVWDGNTEGLEVFDGAYYKVSDIAPTANELNNGGTVTYCIEHPEAPEDQRKTVIPFTEVANIDGIFFVAEMLLVVPQNTAITMGISAGIYFPCDDMADGDDSTMTFVSALQINGYTGFGGGSVKENTIWVDTSTKITSHAFSATEPTNPVEGMVWLKTSTTSVAPFNALKKNSIMVYVDGCSQYTSGAWTAKNAQIYQNGWKTLATSTIILFDGENDVTDISGGWAKWSGKGASTIAADNGVIRMTAPAAQAARTNGTFGHETAVDLTGYTTVTVTTNTIPTNSDNRSYVAVYDSSKTKLKSETLKKSTTSTVLDISDVTGARYVGFFVESYYSTASYTWDAVTISVKSVVVS